MNVNFDGNEWFFILTSLVMVCLFSFIGNYFPTIIVLIVWVFNIGYVATLDYILLATPFKLYYFGDNKTYEFSGALFHLLMYPSASLIFLYGYDKWELKGAKTAWYIVGWSGFSLLFEWLCLKSHALTYTGWRLYYSIPFYPATSVMLIILYRFTRKKLRELQLRRNTTYK